MSKERKCIVKGKIVENKYSIVNYPETKFDEKGNGRLVYKQKPGLKCTQEVVEWKNICEFNGNPAYSSQRGYIYIERLNISEIEEVLIEKEIFRADLNEFHLFSNKILETRDDTREFWERDFNNEIRLFNKTMIESNDRLKAYCDLHGLVPEELDCFEVFKFAYPDSEWEIVDGKLREVKKKIITASTLNAYDAVASASFAVKTDICDSVISSTCIGY